jgi:hypothetical protein
MESGNMDKYEIESKLFMKPTRNRLVLKMILNIVLFVIAIYTLFYIIMDGFSITKIGELCLAILVVSYYNVGAKSNYQFSILNLEVYSDKIRFVYNAIKMGTYTGPIQYELLVNNIDKIEYSKQLNAIRFTGNISRIINSKVEIENELVVYCQNEAYQIINSLENRLACNVTVLE